MDRIIQQLKSSRRILLATHTNPDGDAMGSLVALGLCLDTMGKTVTLYDESPIPAVYRYLPEANRVIRHLPIGAMYDTAVVLDCGDFARIGEGQAPVRQCSVIINIDHHTTNTGFGTLQEIDTNACATAEIVYRIIKTLAVPITRNMAVSIYTGILTDTGSFRFSNTNRAAFTICQEMIDCGVNPYDVARHVYGTYSLGRIKLLNLALDSIEISENGKLSMMTLTQDMMKETGTRSQDVDGIINYARAIEEVRVAVLIQESVNGQRVGDSPDQYHVSLRSDGTVDVGAVASTFGGGGHISAAGFNIETTLSDLKTKFFDLAEIIEP
jgi:bifunctional oligoribonuclease and PAP phosphatase NrnA